MINSLTQVVLKTMSPGVPDFYQGTEFWDLSLVDPDNRRPVDFAQRREALDQLAPFWKGTGTRKQAAALLQTWEDGRIKLYITTCGLRLRRRFPQVLGEGEYLPLEVEGERGEHAVAVARRHGDQWVLAVVPRLVGGLLPPEHLLPTGAETWQGTRLVLPVELTAPTFRNLVTGEQLTAASRGGCPTLLIADVLQTCPVAVLLPEKG